MDETRLSIKDRIVSAISICALMLVGGLALILLSPVFLITNLLSSNPAGIGALLDGFADGLERGKQQPRAEPEDEEGWKKDHDDQYGR